MRTGYFLTNFEVSLICHLFCVCQKSKLRSWPLNKVKHFCQPYCKKTTALTTTTWHRGIICPVSDLSVLQVEYRSIPSGLKNPALPLRAHPVNFLLFTPSYFLFSPQGLCVHTVVFLFFFLLYLFMLVWSKESQFVSVMLDVTRWQKSEDANR